MEDDQQRKTTSKYNKWNVFKFWTEAIGIKLECTKEDDLKIWKEEYLGNYWSDLTQIWNLI